MLFWHQSDYAESEFQCFHGFSSGNEIYNLILRLLCSLLSLVFYSSKRCLFDSSNMTCLYGHPVDMDTFYGSFSVHVLTGLCCTMSFNGLFLVRRANGANERERMFFSLIGRRKKGQKPFFQAPFFLEICFAAFLWNSDGLVFLPRAVLNHFGLLKDTSTVPPILKSSRVMTMLGESISFYFFIVWLQIN